MDSKIPEDKIVALANEQTQKIKSRFLKFAEDIQEIKGWEEGVERKRISSLIDQAMQDHLNVEQEMFNKETSTFSHYPFAVHERGLKVLEQLKECVGSGNTSFEPVAAPQPLTCEGDVAVEDIEYIGVSTCSDHKCSCAEKKASLEAEASCTPPIMAAGEPFSAQDEAQLKKDIVRVMQMSGTVKHGNDAYWSLEQLSVGLAKLYPFLGDEVLTSVIEDLVSEKVVLPRSSAHGPQFALSNDYASEPEDESLEEIILTVLRSAKEEGGEYCGWTFNQLVFAVKRSSARLGDETIRKEVEELIGSGRIVSFEGKTTRYVTIDEETMDRYKEKLLSIGHEPLLEETATEEPAEAAEAAEAAEEPAETSGGNNDSKSWEEVKKALELGGDDTSIALSVITHMRQAPQRLWRDYDLEGLYKTALSKITMKEADGAPGDLQIALDFLVDLKLVEKIPRDTRPGIREDRWALTRQGRVGS